MTRGGALRDAAPRWAALLSMDAAGADWIAAPTLPSGTATSATLVRTTLNGELIRVAEREPGTRLPRRCPELHVNPDSSFCIGRRIYSVEDPAAVLAFWQDLGQYLVNQHYAARRGRWPAGRWLSHGAAAADRQAEAEAIASRIGIEDEYSACLETDEGWIAERVRSGRHRLIRSDACPRGCRGADGCGIPLRSCRRRQQLQRMVTVERARRMATADFFVGFRRMGVVCCGCIEGCGLSQNGTIA